MIEKNRLTEESRKSRVLLNFFLSMLVAYLLFKGGAATGQLIFGPMLRSISKSTVFIENQNLIIQFVQLLVFGLISSMLFIWVLAIEGREIETLGFITVETKSTQPVGTAALLNISIMLVGWLLQGATEEILTRGWLMNVIGARYNIIIGLIVSSVFFGLIHS